MTYALRLSEDEQRRYRLMASMARTEEAAIWAAAGIRPGAAVAAQMAAARVRRKLAPTDK